MLTGFSLSLKLNEKSLKMIQEKARLERQVFGDIDSFDTAELVKRYFITLI